MATTLAERLDAVDWDRVFQLVNGDVVHVRGEYAPDVYHSEADDVEIHGDGWTALTGNTSQYGYSGAVMHASEFIGRDIAAQLQEMAEDEPSRLFAVVVVESLDDEEPAGWAIVTRA